jgi:2-methylisocitrate lyase-like PEP mutase family enzyme
LQDAVSDTRQQILYCATGLGISCIRRVTALALGHRRGKIEPRTCPEPKMPTTANTPSVADKRRTFRQLHESGCFAIPNPWDVGSARYLQGMGFKALATTSSGFAWSRAHPDNGVTRDMVLSHLRELVAATDLPVNADFESGFATDAAGVAESVRLAVETGVAGLSIEDSTGDVAAPLFTLDVAVQRMRAARRAIDAAGGDTLLVGRAECFLVGRPDLGETIARLQAYADAGADCLYAPGIKTRDQIAAVVAAVAPKPVNLLVGGVSELTMADIAALGVRRVSVGGAMARAAWGGFIHAATELAEHGRFDGFADAASGQALNTFFAEKS